MVSAIDPTKPETGLATTASVRNNFAAAKAEIESLQLLGFSVNSVAEMQALSMPATPNIATYISGYRRPGDGAAGQFFWDATSTAIANGGTVINPDGNLGPGRWVRALAKPLNVLWFGAKGDLTQYPGSAITAGFPVLSGTFPNMIDGTPLAPGMAVLVWGAGPGGIDLSTTIDTVDSPTQITLATNASTTVSNASAWIGTDNAPAFAAAVAASPRDIYAPPGRYGFRTAGVELTQFGHRIYGVMPMDLNIGSYPFGSTHTALYSMAPIDLIRNAPFAGTSQVVETLYLECLLQVGNTTRADYNTGIGLNFGYTGAGSASSRYSANAGLQSQIRGVAIKGFREGLRIGDPQIPTQSWGVTLENVKLYSNMTQIRISDMGTEGALSGAQQSIASGVTALQSDGRWLALTGRYARQVIGVLQMGGFWQWNQLRAESNHINFKLKSRPSGQQGQATLIQPSVEGAFSAIFEADSNVGLTVKGGYGSFSRGSNVSITTTAMVRVNQQDSQQNVNPSNITIEDFQLTDGVWSFGDKPRVILFTGKGYGAQLTATLTAGAITGVTVVTPGEGYSGSETVDVTGDGVNGAITLQAINGQITGATITNAGSGYTTPPTLTVDGGSGALGTATVSAGGIASIAVTAPGANYLTPPVVKVDNVSAYTPAVYTATVDPLTHVVTGFVQSPGGAGAGYVAGTIAPHTARKAGTSLVRIEAPAGVVTSPANVFIERLICTDLLDMTDRIMPASTTSFPRFAPKRVSIVAGNTTAGFATPLVYEWADNRQGPTVIQGAWNNRPLADIGSEASIFAAPNDSFYTGYVGLLTTGTGFKTIATIVVPPDTAPSPSGTANLSGVIRLVGSCRYSTVSAGAANLIDWSLWYERVGGVWAFDVSGGNSGATIKTGGPAGVPIIKVVEAAGVLSLQVHRASAASNGDFYDLTVKHISTQPRTMRIGV